MEVLSSCVYSLPIYIQVYKHICIYLYFCWAQKPICTAKYLVLQCKIRYSVKQPIQEKKPSVLLLTKQITVQSVQFKYRITSVKSH